MSQPRLTRSGRGLCVLAFALAAVTMGRAQTQSAVERTYGYSQGNVQAAVRELRASEGGRLPALDGFVLRTAVPLSQFERPYFELLVDVVSVSAEQTLVRVSAKITAWYSGSDPSRSEYRALKSNGRLEADFLDRLDDALKKRGPGIPEKPTPKASQGRSLRDELARGVQLIVPPDAAAPSASTPGPSLTAPETATTTTATPASPESVDSLNQEVARLRSEQEEIEQGRVELDKEIKRLEEMTQKQVVLSDLVAVKISGTAVRDRPADDGHLLFRGEVEDEYKFLEKRGEWIRVWLEGNTQAWVRSSAVTILAENEKPAGGVDKPAAGADPSSESAPEFEVVREQVQPFSGDWPPLKGKQVLFVFAQPRSQIPESTLGQQQLAYAKRAFTERYDKATGSPQQFAGVVIVFLGTRGGVAAATVADIRQWAKRAITIAAFVQRCSFDPPEAFRDVRRR